MTFDGHTEIAHLRYNIQEDVFETTRTAPCKWEMSMLPHRPVTSFDVATGLEIRLFEQRPKQLLRGVVSAAGGIVGRSSSMSSLVPPGSDSFSLTSPSKSYVIQNQRLIHYNGNHHGKRFSSEIGIGSSSSGTRSIYSVTNSSKKSTSRLASTMTVPLGGLVSQPSTSQTTLWKLTIPFTHHEEAQVTLTLMHRSDYAHWLYKELRARRKEELASSTSSWGWGWADDDEEEEDGDEYNNSNESDVYFYEWLYYCCFEPR